MKDYMTKDNSDLIIAICVLLFIVLTFVGCTSFNESHITIVDEDVHVVDKYHKAEDCTWYSDGNGGSYESCDPEKFVVIFDNKQSVDLKRAEPWAEVREGQLWHYFARKGRLWTMDERVYKL